MIQCEMGHLINQKQLSWRPTIRPQNPIPPARGQSKEPQLFNDQLVQCGILEDIVFCHWTNQWFVSYLDIHDRVRSANKIRICTHPNGFWLLLNKNSLIWEINASLMELLPRRDAGEFNNHLLGAYIYMISRHLLVPGTKKKLLNSNKNISCMLVKSRAATNKNCSNIVTSTSPGFCSWVISI